MKKTSLLLLTGISFLLLTTACKDADKVGKLVPSDALFAVHINTNALSKKLSWEEIQNTEWFQNINNSAEDTIAQRLLRNPESSGIDTKSDLVFFMKKQGNGGYFAFTGSLKDAKAFESFNQQISKGTPAIKDGEYRSANIDNNGIVTWNDNRFIYLMNAPTANMSGLPVRYQQDEEEQEEQDEQFMPPTYPPFTPDSLRIFAKQLFEMDDDNTLGKDDRFSNMIKEEGDVHFWMNSGKIYGDFGAGMMSMMKVNVLFDGNISATTLNFDNGKVTMKSNQYYGKEMSNFLDKYPGKKIDKDLLNRIPSQNVVAVLALNYPPDGLKEFLRLIGVDGMVNGFLGKVNYSVDEFVKANKGDLLIAVTDFTMKSDTVNLPDIYGENRPSDKPSERIRKVPDLKILFATSVNDRAAFDKLVTTLKGQTGDLPQGTIPDITYKVNNNWFVASNNPAQVDKFLTGGSADHPFTDKLSGNLVGGYIDFQQLLKNISAFPADDTDTSGRAVLDASVKLWKDAYFTTAAYDDGKMKSEGVLNFIDENTNSLKQLNNYLNLISKSVKKDRFRGDQPMIDSVPAPRRSF